MNTYAHPFSLNKRIVNVLFPIIKRFKTAPAKKGEKKYTNTVLLPKTKFNLWLNAAKLQENDSELFKECRFSELYKWQRNNLTGEEFVLHDGPPYANGMPHMGHAINKILKDIINRHKVLKGRKVHYIPGWDCHGLPIELKAMSGLDSSTMTPLSIRQKARNAARRAIEDQKNIFESWGVMADWKNGCYHTYDSSYITNQLKQFWKLYKMGYIYRDLKPVYWSPSSKTALAEAELEYNESHTSETATVRFSVSCSPSCFDSTEGMPVDLLVWTTTPWSLFGNSAIAVNRDISYSLVTDDRGKRYIIASNLVGVWQEKLNTNFNIIKSFKGAELEGCKYTGLSGETLPVVFGSHVTEATGTGLVHTAPAHGHDDYLLSKEYNLPLKCVVNEVGLFNEEVPKSLQGLSALENTKTILIHLKKTIVHTESITHSYPYDWRTKKPVVIRASKQWFVDTESIKASALELLKDVEIIPSGAGGLSAKLEKRPYWCISRQRAWGVQIPVIYSHDEPVISRELIDRYCNLTERHGPDFWWKMGISEIITPELAALHNLDMKSTSLGGDILDIWFDSGLSWSGVLDGRTADLYLEGVDQFTGWFQSSLLTSVALQKKSPYKKIFVHGFAVDEKGRKMSKSEGNIVDPVDIVKGSKNIKPYGVNVLRWWVSAHGSHHSSVPVSSTTLSDSVDAIYKIRNISKFLLGCLHGYPVDCPAHHFHVVDHHALHTLNDFLEQIDTFYESYQFNKVCKAIVNYVTNQLSGFYCHIIKDRLYCDSEDDAKRRGAQFVLSHLLEGLMTASAPILPFLAEEINKHHPHSKDSKGFFFKVNCFKVDESKLASRLKVDPVIDQALAVKSVLAKETPVNCNSWQLKAHINASPAVFSVLKVLQKEQQSSNSELCELLQVSQVELSLDKDCGSFTVQIAPYDKHLCERCRKYTSNSKETVCERCQTVINSLSC